MRLSLQGEGEAEVISVQKKEKNFRETKLLLIQNKGYWLIKGDIR